MIEMKSVELEEQKDRLEKTVIEYELRCDNFSENENFRFESVSFSRHLLPNFWPVLAQKIGPFLPEIQPVSTDNSALLKSVKRLQRALCLHFH